MKILLDFDGVLVTTPSWQKVPQLDDGFMAFNKACVQNLTEILATYSAEIVLTTSHRIHYDCDTWQTLLANRGIVTHNITKLNQVKHFSELSIRRDEVLQWVASHPTESFIILDDDKSLCELPEPIKSRWIQTSFMLGLTDELKKQALHIMARLRK